MYRFPKDCAQIPKIVFHMTYYFNQSLIILLVSFFLVIPCDKYKYRMKPLIEAIFTSQLTKLVAGKFIRTNLSCCARLSSPPTDSIESSHVTFNHALNELTANHADVLTASFRAGPQHYREFRSTYPRSGARESRLINPSAARERP